MNKSKILLMVSTILLVMVMTNILQAQYIIEQIEYEIPINFDLLPEDVDFNDAVSEAKYFLNLSEETLKESAKGMYGEVEIIKSTIYEDGENVAVESVSPQEGKTSVILDSKNGMIYYVLWSQNQVFEMSKDDMEAMQEEAEAASQKMIEQMPEEMQEQIRAAMEAENQYSDHKETLGPVKSTGKKANKYGYECEQYMAVGDSKVILIWASDDSFGLSEKVQSLSEKISAILPSEDEEDIDEWDAVAGKIPVEVRTYYFNSMEGPKMEVQAITNIKASKPSPDKFILPDGFQRSSMKDMMSQMMEMMEMQGDEGY